MIKGALDDGGLSPACMADSFQMFGAFSHLLHDNPLPLDEVSALELMVSFSHGHPESSQAPMVGLKLSMAEVDRGLVTLVASDHPRFEVCNPNGYWYLADAGSSPDVLLLLTGRALSCYCWSTAKFSVQDHY